MISKYLLFETVVVQSFFQYFEVVQEISQLRIGQGWTNGPNRTSRVDIGAAC